MTSEQISAWATVLGAGLAAVGLGLAARQLRIQNRQRLLELGNFYIARYWQIDDDLLLTVKGTAEHTRQRHRYLRLSEDEYDAARLGWLDGEQWSVWHRQFLTKTSSTHLESDLSVCDPEGQAFTKIRACLGQLRSDGKSHEWGDCAARRPATDNGDL